MNNEFSNCEYYKNGWCTAHRTFMGTIYLYCQEKQDCYYKQLNKLKQKIREVLND